MTYEDWTSPSPSAVDGILLFTLGMTEDEELQAIYEVAEFMRSIIGELKNYPDDGFYKALVLLHKFFRKFSLRNLKYDKYLVGTVCLFLGSKIEDCPVKLADLAVLHHRAELTRDKWPAKPPTEEQRIYLQGKICEFESELLRQIGYDLDIELPYNYIWKYREYPAYKIEQVVKVAEWFCNDTFLKPMCLFYHPMQIACGCIYFATLFFKRTLPNKDEIPWYKFLHPDIELKHLKEIAKMIKIIYQRMELQKRQFDARFGKQLDSMNAGKMESLANKPLYRMEKALR